MPDFEVKGADDIDRLVKAIRTHADSKAIRRELMAGLNRATKHVRGEMKEAIPVVLPSRGGLAALVQKDIRWTTSAKGGKWAGVTIWAKSKNHDIRTLTGRRLRHPVFGNRERWVDQTEGVTPAVFLAKFDDQKPHVKREIVRVMEDIARKVGGF